MCNQKCDSFTQVRQRSIAPYYKFISCYFNFWGEPCNNKYIPYRAEADPGGVKSNPPLAHSLVWKIPIWTFTFAQKYLSGNLRTPLHRILDPPQQSIWRTRQLELNEVHVGQ